jgi:hypothetical protein
MPSLQKLSAKFEKLVSTRLFPYFPAARPVLT